MKAVLCTRHGEPAELAVDEVDAPTPAGDEVLIDVRACAVNFPDVLMVRGQYQIRPPLPFIPGSEVAGVIAAVGADVVALSVGDRVMAATQTGGMAQRVTAKDAAVTRIPAEVGFEEASTVLYAYGTALHALRDRAQLSEGETLLVLGAGGGVGLAAVELGHNFGARVIAAASSEEKLERCIACGADEVVNYTSEDLKERVRDLTAGDGADVVFDPVGGPFSEPAVRATAWGGRMLVVGFAAGEIPRIPLNVPLLRGCAIVGVYWGGFSVRFPERSRRNNADIAAMLERGEIAPYVSRRFPLEEAPTALSELAERRAIGKIVITP